MDKNPIGKSTMEKSGDVWIPTLCYACNKGICLIRVHRVNGDATTCRADLVSGGDTLPRQAAVRRTEQPVATALDRVLPSAGVDRIGI